MTTITKTQVATLADVKMPAQPTMIKLPVIPAAKDDFLAKPVDRLEEAAKTVAWTAPIGGAAGWLGSRFVQPGSYQTALDYLKNHLSPDFWTKYALHLNELVGKNGITAEMVERLQGVINKMTAHEVLQNPEHVLKAAHFTNDVGHLAIGAGLGALFTGLVGAGMSQLFANDKIKVQQTLADINERLEEEKAQGADKKMLGRLKAQREAMENRAEIEEIKSLLAAEKKAELEKNS